ncbi:hypothetical protein DQ04_03611050 [Trypanosoma grayi]|uniref:hypothetical protein n=1 Tax=Trypanosoma grayi TaxID=71804 RepID=UPI0004F448A9|nr:hypothetical protein DQ04_03611050 [Trypanosoma grayi]KEG10530.1 hypothetical protein DQ04_03611050 [Trypanosoma grayi]
MDFAKALLCYFKSVNGGILDKRNRRAVRRAPLDVQGAAAVVEGGNAVLTCATLRDQKIVEMVGGYFSRRAYSMFFFSPFRRTSSFWLNFRNGKRPCKHCQALHCIAKIAPRSVLLMYGTADDLLSCRHSVQLYETASEPKELYRSEGAFHCGPILQERVRQRFVLSPSKGSYTPPLCTVSWDVRMVMCVAQ